MLRKFLIAPCRLALHQNKCYSSGRNAKINSKTVFSPSRQVKAMGKLFGVRVAGSKKHWYPTQESTKGLPNHSLGILNVSQLGKSTTATGGNKSTLRRMTVLNKVFMEHITDLLATGEASEAILGKGLQVTRVKIAPDFNMLNIYWLGKGEISTDAALEQELKACASVLRHQLSQLGLVGEVPHIKFVRDKQYANINQVEALLNTMDFSQKDEVDEELAQDDEVTNIDGISLQKAEFFGDKIGQPRTEHALEMQDSSSQMRHDAFGLDHLLIMSKISAKMRKSKMAWDMHHKAQQPLAKSTEDEEHQATHQTITTRLESVHKRIEDLDQKDTDDFNKFLANRRERKRIPERKRHQRMFVDWTAETNELDEAVLSPHQRRLMEAEDFLHEEHKDRKA